MRMLLGVPWRGGGNEDGAGQEEVSPGPAQAWAGGGSEGGDAVAPAAIVAAATFAETYGASNASSPTALTWRS